MPGPAYGNPVAIRVLVVDDQPAMRDVARDVLELFGYDVVEAESARDALAELARGGVTVVVTDIYMDGGSPVGLDLIAEVKRTSPTIRVVAVSGGGGDIDGCDPLDKAARIGADSCLRKPFSATDLLAAVAGTPRPSD